MGGTILQLSQRACTVVDGHLCGLGSPSVALGAQSGDGTVYPGGGRRRLRHDWLQQGLLGRPLPQRRLGRLASGSNLGHGQCVGLARVVAHESS